MNSELLNLFRKILICFAFVLKVFFLTRNQFSCCNLDSGRWSKKTRQQSFSLSDSFHCQYLNFLVFFSLHPLNYHFTCSFHFFYCSIKFFIFFIAALVLFLVVCLLVRNKDLIFGAGWCTFCLLLRALKPLKWPGMHAV